MSSLDTKPQKTPEQIKIEENMNKFKSVKQEDLLKGTKLPVGSAEFNKEILESILPTKSVESTETPEQRWQNLYGGFVKHIQNGGNWKEYIAENANVEEAIELTIVYVSQDVQTQMIQNFRVNVLKMYGLV